MYTYSLFPKCTLKGLSRDQHMRLIIDRSINSIEILPQGGGGTQPHSSEPADGVATAASIVAQRMTETSYNKQKMQLPASKYMKFADHWRRRQAAARKAVPATAPVRAKPLPILPKAPADLRSQLPLRIAVKKLTAASGVVLQALT
ncbi:MAG: hypothetical protein FRX49_05603 [Trebouxia sp. A1-2]|nr:MAG: hypothetical protein FRX49_05603 [Trebouxia sp. A1-2]